MRARRRGPANIAPPAYPPPLQSANALTYEELQGLSYLQVKGTGVANTCPTIKDGSTNPKDIKPGQYTMDKFCIEPTTITVKEESQASRGGRSTAAGSRHRDAGPASGCRCWQRGVGPAGIRTPAAAASAPGQGSLALLLQSKTW